MTTKKLEKSAQKAIMSLRKKRLKQGLPFMINSDLLPSGQCYLEFHDGSIKLVKANSNGTDFEVIEVLDELTIEILRNKFNLV